MPDATEPADPPEPLYTIPPETRRLRDLATQVRDWVRQQPWASLSPPAERKPLVDASIALLAEANRLAAEQMAEAKPPPK